MVNEQAVGILLVYILVTPGFITLFTVLLNRTSNDDKVRNLS